MISIKNPSQIAKMREAGALLHEVLTQVKARIEPGITTKELDHFAEQLIRRHGAVPSFLHYEGYPASLCTSVDEQVVHGIPGNTVLREGSIISIDGGLVLDGWQADSAFTAGVGQISPEAQRLIDVTERSFFEGIAQAREGNRISDIGHAVQTFVEAHGYSAVRALCGHGIGPGNARRPRGTQLRHPRTRPEAPRRHDDCRGADDRGRSLGGQDAERRLDGRDQ